MSHFGKCVLKNGLALIADYFLWINKYAKHPEKYDIKIRYGKLRKLLINVSKGFDVEYHVEGLENIPDEACCFVSNHLSNYDPLALISIIDKPCTFVAKKELIKWPFIGKMIKDIDGLFIDREDLKQSLRIMMKVEEDLKVNRNKNWIIFPEGTRNKDPMKNMKEFHHGTFRPAVKAGVPIIPVAIFGSTRVLYKKPKYKKYPVFVKFLKPISPEDYKGLSTNQIAQMSQEMIEKVVSFELRQLDHREMSKCDKKYRFNRIK